MWGVPQFILWAQGSHWRTQKGTDSNMGVTNFLLNMYVPIMSLQWKECPCVFSVEDVHQHWFQHGHEEFSRHKPVMSLHAMLRSEPVYQWAHWDLEGHTIGTCMSVAMATEFCVLRKERVSKHFSISPIKLLKNVKSDCHTCYHIKVRSCISTPESLHVPGRRGSHDWPASSGHVSPTAAVA